jgi:hypothetical protein
VVCGRRRRQRRCERGICTSLGGHNQVTGPTTVGIRQCAPARVLSPLSQPASQCLRPFFISSSLLIATKIIPIPFLPRWSPTLQLTVSSCHVSVFLPIVFPSSSPVLRIHIWFTRPLLSVISPSFSPPLISQAHINGIRSSLPRKSTSHRRPPQDRQGHRFRRKVWRATRARLHELQGHRQRFLRCRIPGETPLRAVQGHRRNRHQEGSPGQALQGASSVSSHPFFSPLFFSNHPPLSCLSR